MIKSAMLSTMAVSAHEIAKSECRWFKTIGSKSSMS